jgi:hypothetical protein
MPAWRWLLVVMLAVALLSPAEAAAQAAGTPEWVRRSDQVTLAVVARLGPFRAVALSGYGITSFDTEIGDFAPGVEDREREALRAALADVAGGRTAETDANVRHDIGILSRALELDLRAVNLARAQLLPYSDLPEVIYRSLAQLLDERLPRERQLAALARLRKYAGAAGGEPVALLTERRLRTALADMKRVGPPREELEQDLAQAALLVAGIGELFRRQKIEGWEPAHAALAKQVDAYAAFVREQVVPRARDDFRLPGELYALALERVGIDVAPEELARRAADAAAAVQGEMQAAAGEVALARGWPAGDYREALRRLKAEQVVGAAILPHYRTRLAEVEAVIRRHALVTLPERAARIRLASAAESAANPAPRMEPPAFIGGAKNASGEGEFVLPLTLPDASGGALRYDDFTWAAASWTIVAHELRPGHELQFVAMAERGVSLARAIFAFNSGTWKVGRCMRST